VSAPDRSGPCLRHLDRDARQVHLAGHRIVHLADLLDWRLDLDDLGEEIG